MLQCIPKQCLSSFFRRRNRTSFVIVSKFDQIMAENMENIEYNLEVTDFYDLFEDSLVGE